MDFNKVVSKTKTNLTFTEAIRELIKNKDAKIHKLEWEDKDFYGVLQDNLLRLHKPDGKFYDWIISEGDMSGEDYIIL